MGFSHSPVAFYKIFGRALSDLCEEIRMSQNPLLSDLDKYFDSMMNSISLESKGEKPLSDQTKYCESPFS